MNATAERVQALLQENPVQTLQVLADKVGVSSERIRQICMEEKLERLTPVKPLIETRCRECRVLLPPKVYAPRCKPCREKMILARTTILTCWTCKEQFERATYIVRSISKRFGEPNTFCSRRCLGKHAGINWGIRTQGNPIDNAAKTHCPWGHAYDQANTYICPSTGGRQCRKCVRRHQFERYHRNKGRAA